MIPVMTTQRSKNCRSKCFPVLTAVLASLSLSLCTIPNVYFIFSNPVSSETQHASMLSVCYRLARDAVPNWLLDAVTFRLECAWILTCVLRFVSFAESYPDWRRAQTGTSLILLCAYKCLNIHCIRFLYECLYKINGGKTKHAFKYCHHNAE
jgi:hypothetical protein